MIKSLWHTASRSEIRSTPTPNITPSHCSVKSKFSMISLGTETLVVQKKIPTIIQNYMTVPYMEGSFNLPIKYGYALSGVLDDGKKIHVMHPHQNKCIVELTSIFKACDDLPLERIPLISNIETVINAIWECQLENNQVIAICGFGNIGSLLAITLKYYYNLNPKIIESNEWRKQKAIELGFELFEDNESFDVVFNTAANENALQFCINHANEEGKIIEIGWHGTSQTTLTLGENFHKNRIRIISSQVSKIPIAKRKEFNYYKRKLLAVDILKNSAFDKLITHIIPFEESPNFFDSVRQQEIPDGLIYLIKY